MFIIMLFYSCLGGKERILHFKDGRKDFDDMGEVVTSFITVYLS